LYNSEFNYAVV